MSVTLHFDPPTIYNVSGYIIGEASGVADPLVPVASGFGSSEVGTYPTWINTLTYAPGLKSNYYSVRFETSDGYNTPWSDRMYGQEGSSFSYFVHTSDRQTVYLVPAPVSGVIPDWLNINSEYSVNVISSGLYGENTTFMADDYCFSFITEICPLWSTTESVRLTVGPLINAIPDSTLNRIIYKTSLTAQRRFLQGANPYGCNWNDVPETLYRWVTCMAGIMALNASVGGTSAGGNTTKHLGTMTVKYDSGGTDGSTPADVRKSLEECIQKATDLIASERGTLVKHGIKSIDNVHLQHPFRDATWGRMPRNTLYNGNIGPWYQSHEYGTYTRRNLPQ